MAGQDFEDIKGRKVMVIDDSNTIRRSAEIFLKQGGHEVLEILSVAYLRVEFVVIDDVVAVHAA